VLYRLSLTVVALVVPAGAVALSLPRIGHAQSDTAPDHIIPVAQSIQALGLDIDLGGQKRTITVEYGRRGGILFPLPVWVVQGDPVRQLGADKKTERRLSAADPFLRPGDTGPARLQVTVLNKVSQRTGQKVTCLENQDLDWDGLRVTLCAAGTGRGAAPGEVLLSHTAVFPKAVAKESGSVFFDLLPTARPACF
jgi:hypothetical protein